MKTRAIGISTIWLVAIAVLLAPAFAAGQDDPPGRVARLNYSQGSVSLQPGGQGDWVTAVPNRPLVSGDNLWADEHARAELHVGSTAIRLDDSTSITLLDLDDHTLQIRLALGSLILHVRHLGENETVEVDTPNLAFTALRSGDYRINVSSEGDETIATIWHGRGRPWAADSPIRC